MGEIFLAVLAMIPVAAIVALIRFVIYRFSNRNRYDVPSKNGREQGRDDEYYSNRYMGGFNNLSLK